MKRILFFLIIGGIGGVLLGNLILPVLVKADFFGSANFFKLFVVSEEQPIIKETEKIITAEPDFWKEIVKKTERSVVLVQYFSSSGKLISQSNGTILTNDGLIVVPLNTVPAIPATIQVFYDDKIINAFLTTTDSANNLALIKADASNLPILDFVDFNDLVLGQNILVVGKKIMISKITTFAHSSLISEITAQVFYLDLERGQQRGPISGALAVDSNGKMTGMIQLSSQGEVFVIPQSFFRGILEKHLNSNS